MVLAVIPQGFEAGIVVPFSEVEYVCGAPFEPPVELAVGDVKRFLNVGFDEKGADA